MRRHRIKLTLLVVMIVFGMLAVAPTAGVQAKEVYKLTLATQHPAEAPMNKVINTGWANYLAKASKGRLKIVQYPAEQAAKEPHIGSLSDVSPGEGTVRIEFDQYLLNLAIHQIPEDFPNAYRSRAMGAGRSPNNGTNHVIENAGIIFSVVHR